MAVRDQHLVGVGAARGRPVGVRAADGPHPGDLAPVRGERSDGTDRQGVLVEAAEREIAPVVVTEPSRAMLSRRAVPSVVTPSTSLVPVPGGRAGPKRWPLGTAALSACPPAIAGPTGAPVAATPGCWVSVLLKKSPLTPATAPAEPASRDTVARAATFPGYSSPTPTWVLRRSTLSTWACVTPLAAWMSNWRYSMPGAMTTAPDAPLAGAAPTRAAPASTLHAERTVSTVRNRPPRRVTVPPDVSSTVPGLRGSAPDDYRPGGRPASTTRERMRKRTPSGASSEKPLPRPGTTSTISRV